MFTDGQRVDRSKAPPALAATYPQHPYFIAKVSEHDEMGSDGKPRIRVRIELLSPSNERLTVAETGTAVYWSLKKVTDALPQVEGFAA